LLVVSGPIATFVYGLTEKPGRPELIVQWDHGSKTGDLIKQIEQSLHEVVRSLANA
jgi:hypothetical protein